MVNVFWLAEIVYSNLEAANFPRSNTKRNYGPNISHADPDKGSKVKQK